VDKSTLELLHEVKGEMISEYGWREISSLDKAILKLMELFRTGEEAATA